MYSEVSDMKTILVCNQKGGVGKSLVADEIAFSFERSGIPVSFYDLDAQGGPLHRFPVVERRADSRIISFDLIECLLRMCRNSEVRSRHEASGRDAFGNCAAHISASDNCDFHAVVKFKFQR